MQTFSDLSADAVLTWWNSVDTFLLDCDGVLWRSTDGVPGVDEAVAAMRAAGKHVFFVTNNSTKSRAEYVSKLLSVAGVHAFESEIMSSAYAAAVYCKAAGVRKKVYVIGQEGLVEELRCVGLDVLGPEDSGKVFHFGTFKPTDLDPDVEAVVSARPTTFIHILPPRHTELTQVAGFDGAACYYKLAVASSYLRYRPEVRFVATNRDLTFPDTHQLVPGGGVGKCAAVQGEAGAARTPPLRRLLLLPSQSLRR